jgi:hypothetical protein
MRRAPMEESQKLPQAAAGDTSGAKPKKRYVPPSLIEYGSIEKLTQTGNGTGTDGGSVGMQMVCL